LRRLTSIETNACRFLLKHGPYTPGDAALGRGGKEVIRVFRGLERKGRVLIEVGDDGPTFSLTAQGEADAA
jgi:hypothetical protein